METKGIDLTKCNNCRAWVRYRYDKEYEDTGRIEKVVEEGRKREEWMRFVADEDGELVSLWEDGKICDHIKDFKIIPRDPETYQDWQVGDIIGSINEDGEIDNCVDEQCRVIFRSGELVAIAENCEDADINGVYTCSQLYREGWRLVLTDIEKQIIEERKKAEWKPQDGDICYAKSKNGYSAIYIYRQVEQLKTAFYAAIDSRGRLHLCGCAITNNNIIKFRPATKEEKQILFDAMKKDGKRWNAEKKVVEDIPKPYEFRKGEPVLARNYPEERWELYVLLYNPEMGRGSYGLTRTNEDLYEKLDCIPYNERTMHLLGTTEDYKEE